MGFLEGLGKFINNTVEYHNKEVERKERIVNNTERRASNIDSDRELVRRFQNSSGLEKMGYARELENRGYLEKDENGKYIRTSKTL